MKFILVCVLLLPLPLLASDAETLLQKARLLYYKSVTSPDSLDNAIALFEQIRDSDTNLAGRATTYLGSLIALKAKYEPWPLDKAKFGWQGISTMDKGLRMNPDDIESLFIHGTTCFFLPRIFGRADDAQRDFKRVIELLPEKAHEYDPTTITNVIDFILERVRVKKEQENALRNLRIELATN